MEHNTPFAVKVDENNIENHIVSDENAAEFPFEFSRESIWGQSFLPPESNDIPFDTLYSQLAEIKLLIDDIKNMLSDIFEAKIKTDLE